jgi:hypothetical protein
LNACEDNSRRAKLEPGADVVVSMVALHLH